MKALALILCLAVPCLAQESDAPLAQLDGGVVCMPASSAMLLAGDLKGGDVEKENLRGHVQPAPLLAILGAVVVSLGAGIAIGIAIQSQQK